ncbi:hypothetical protein J2128_000418 [Methanomicrobium sp. W14]|uniref:hypothetical protein n=1 Tax=Methanomicrobium sp. W14 TaxID=2817839 RepID=UPI0032AECCE1|nr:hypothetical protein [Methanomicrobium sp. W14]
MVCGTENISSAPLKTRQIWEEAGFIPPAEYQDIIEYLHLLNTGYEIPKELCRKICGSLRNKKKKYTVTSTRHLNNFADQCGVSRGKRKTETSVAEDIFCRLIILFLLAVYRKLSAISAVIPVFMAVGYNGLVM